MNTAYLGRFPLDAFGFIRAPASEVTAAARTWLDDVAPSTSRLARQSIEKEISPLATIPTRRLVVDIGDDTSLLVDNLATGTDPSWISYLGSVVKADAIHAVISKPSDREALHIPTFLAGRSVSYWGADQSKRSVHLIDNSGKWLFEAFGEPLACEDGEKYGKRRLRDRFGRDDIIAFVSHVVGRVFGPDFSVNYDRATVFERSDTLSIRNLVEYPI